MTKYSLGIIMEFEPDKNNYLPWEDEYETAVQPRSEEDLVSMLKTEFEETIWTGVKRYELREMITTERIEDY
jgi:predicted RNA-binding protein with PUA-like domain